MDGYIYFNINSDYDVLVLSLCLHSTFLTSDLTTILTSLYSYLALCSLDCGANGQCQGSGCVCQEGWEGNRCQHRSCDSRCSSHGQCKNGTCICQTGFNGKHCSLPACIHPAMRQISLCSGHGICDSTMIGGINNIPSNEVSDHGLEYGSHISKLFNNMDSARPEYRYFGFGLLHQQNLVKSSSLRNNAFNNNALSFRCVCEDGWSGEYCHVEEETECEDGVDNDNSKPIPDEITCNIRSKLHSSIDITIKIISPSIPLSKFTGFKEYKGRIGLHNRFIVASTYPVDNYTTVYCRKNQRTKTHIFICLSSTIITLRSSNVPTKLQHRILTQSHGTILVIRLPSLAYKHVLYIKFMP